MSGAGPRVVHLISEYSTHEAMGRTVTETAMRVPGEHHLVTTKAHDGGDVFASVHELGGRIEAFPMSGRDRLHEILDEINPDVVHLHAGALGPILAQRSGLGASGSGTYPLAMTIYAWPGLPGAAAWKHARWTGLRSSNVLPARVALTAALPPAVVRASVRKLKPLGILSPDPRVIDRLAASGVPVEALPSGAPVDPRRASRTPAPGKAPTVIFAGRSESVRGIRTLIDSFTAVRAAVPDARLRLLLLPRPELAALTAHAAASPVADAIDIVTDPIPDLLGELAGAQVGTWPFLADYTTSPPAMAVAEAMAVGLPVVSTPVACVRSVMRPDVDGVAVAPGDDVALATALIRLLTDAAAWERYAAAGQEAVGRLSWANAADATQALYARAGGALHRERTATRT
ncbi:MAG: glycosyltransferase [Actinobacteria bacterium]|nr:glycosyltransferase [Actinomycetota bacterium]